MFYVEVFMKRFLLSFIFLSLLTFGCKSGSSGGFILPVEAEDVQTAPLITGAEAFLVDDPGNIVSVFTEGDLVDGYVYITDPDLDLKYLWAYEYYPATSEEPYGDLISWDLSEQTHKDMAYLSLECFEVSGEGAWRIDFVAEDAEGNLSNVYSYVYTVNEVEEDPPSGEPPILPVPEIMAEDIDASGTSERIILAWPTITYDYWLAYFEVLRAAVNDVDQAVVIGSTIAKVYSDPVGPKQTYYYWVRIVQKTEAGGEVGTLPTEGKKASTLDDPSNILDELEGQITGTGLYEELGTGINP